MTHRIPVQTRYIAFLLLALLAAATQPLRATGWPQPKGAGFFKLDFTTIQARRFFSPDGRVNDINGAGTLLGHYSAAFYGEYGLTPRLTAIGYVPFWVRNTVNEGVGSITGNILQPGLQNSAFGDVDLGLLYHFHSSGPWVLSATLLLGLPTGDATHPDLLYTGDGEFNQLLRLEWGYGQRRWYATGFVGFNHRTRGFSDELRYHFEAGYWLLPGRLMASAKLAGVKSLFNGDADVSATGLFSNNVEFLSPQVSLTYEHRGQWGVSVQAAGAFAGRNVLAAPALSAGVYWKLNAK